MANVPFYNLKRNNVYVLQGSIWRFEHRIQSTRLWWLEVLGTLQDEY